MSEARSGRGVTAYYARLNHQIENWLLWLLAIFLWLGIAAVLSYSLLDVNQVDVMLGAPASAAAGAAAGSGTADAAAAAASAAAAAVIAGSVGVAPV